MEMFLESPVLAQSAVFLVVAGALIALATWATRRDRQIADRIGTLSARTSPLGEGGRGAPAAGDSSCRR